MNYFSLIDRNLQKKLRSHSEIDDFFLDSINNKKIKYTIKSGEGILFNNKNIDIHHHSGFVKSNNKRIFYQYWEIDETKPIIFFIHGNAENSSTHPLFIYNCINNGFNFFTFDQEGHGDSDGIRGSFSSFDQYIQHTNNLLSICLKIFGKNSKTPPLIFTGFSVGGLIALYYLLCAYYKKGDQDLQKNAQFIKKIFLFAPYLRNHKRIMPRIMECFLRINPFKFSTLKLMRAESQKKIFTCDVKFYINMYKNLSDNKTFLSRRWKDKRIHRLNSLHWLTNLIKAQQKTFKMSKKLQKEKLIPIYFFVNDNDLVVDNIRTNKIYKNLLPFSTLIIQNNFFHEFLDYEDMRSKIFLDKFFKFIEE